MTATATRLRPGAGKSTPAQDASVIGKNIEATVSGNILTLRIDLSERHGDSESGKTVIVAASGGYQAVPGGGGVVLGLNAYIRHGS